MLYRAKRAQLLAIPEDGSAPVKTEAEPMHIRGNPDAPVTLLEFGDYQCQPCGQIASFLDTLVKDYDPRLRIVFRNFPLPTHKHAREAALAAEAAGLQGRYWEMHDALYREQAIWSNAGNARKLFNDYARDLGLNLDQFKKDIDGPQARARVDADEARGKSLGVKNTPTIFVNNREVVPIQPAGMHAIIDAALKEKS